MSQIHYLLLTHLSFIKISKIACLCVGQTNYTRKMLTSASGALVKETKIENLY